MINFFKSNPLLFVAIMVVLVFLMLFLVIKFSKSGSGKNKDKGKSDAIKKSEGKKSDDETFAKEEPEKNTQEEPEGEKPAKEEELQEKPTKTKKVKRAKKSVERVFKRDEETNKTVVSDEVKSSISEEELLSKMGFVTSTKKVSKLAKLPESSPIATEVFIEHPPEEELIPTEVKHDKDNCKYFNKSRRLSKYVEENNFDEMFAEHLSEHYLNMDISKHLDTSEEATNKLYERASKTLANGDVRLVTDEGGEGVRDKSFEESFKEKRRREIYADLIESRNEKEEAAEILSIDEDSLDDDIRLDSKTILVADALLKRKGKKRK